MNKSVLRMQAKKIRSGLDIQALSEAICQQVSRLPEFTAAKNVLLFYPKGNELNLLTLCGCGKNFYLPRVEGENLLVCPYDCNTKMKESEFKILEPCSAAVSPEIIDFAIIPCLMADKNLFRLGYGGGFYDRFIPELRPDCVKVTVVADQLVVDKLPVEEHDIPMDIIVTEQLNIYR
ncbi:MAG: 5-formyltetrahydrofolate cyclo-ligase [Fusobacterium sp.]|nr:5-formyltetrahydrofolate cyclo-ligase [Fusobacterium sp.]